MTYPALELLVQAYLTIDWVDEYEDVWEAVDDFVANEPVAPDLPDDITRLLAAKPAEDELTAFVTDELGCGYPPDEDGLTTTEWLTLVRRRAEAELAEQDG